MNFVSKITKSVPFHIHYHRAYKCWLKKEYVEGKKHVNAASELLPLNGELLLMRAVFNRKLKIYEESVEDAKKALDVFPHERYSIHDRNHLMLYAYKIKKLAEHYLAGNQSTFISEDEGAPVKREDLNIQKTTKLLRNIYVIDGW